MSLIIDGHVVFFCLILLYENSTTPLIKSKNLIWIWLMSASGLSACALLDCSKHSCCFYFSFFLFFLHFALWKSNSAHFHLCICSACWPSWYQNHNPLIKFYRKKGSHIETNGVSMCSMEGTKIEQIFLCYNALELESLIIWHVKSTLLVSLLTWCNSFGLQHRWLVHWKLSFGVKVGGQILISSGEIFWKQELISAVYK